jgi:hypothetical protein
MNYKEKSTYAEPDGIAYTNPKTGEKIILRNDQEVPEGFVKRGGRKTRKSKRKSKRRLFLKSRKIR